MCSYEGGFWIEIWNDMDMFYKTQLKWNKQKEASVLAALLSDWARIMNNKIVWKGDTYCDWCVTIDKIKSITIAIL